MPIKALTAAPNTSIPEALPLNASPMVATAFFILFNAVYVAIADDANWVQAADALNTLFGISFATCPVFDKASFNCWDFSFAASTALSKAFKASSPPMVLIFSRILSISFSKVLIAVLKPKVFSSFWAKTSKSELFVNWSNSFWSFVIAPFLFNPRSDSLFCCWTKDKYSFILAFKLSNFLASPWIALASSCHCFALPIPVALKDWSCLYFCIYSAKEFNVLSILPLTLIWPFASWFKTLFNSGIVFFKISISASYSAAAFLASSNNLVYLATASVSPLSVASLSLSPYIDALSSALL